MPALEEDPDPLNPQQQIGTVLNGRWQLERIQGEGSFSVVFKAHDLLHGPDVAVKCLYKTGLSKSQILMQLEELSILRQVNEHPNITTLLDYFDSPDHLYIVMEYGELDLFESILKTNYGEAAALGLFSELVAAVEFCHSHSIFHRDLKPENCLISTVSNPSIRLTDFGLSTKDSLSTEYGCGSVRYMSPECLGSANQGPYLSSANDVWSLAIILINLLTGKNPWVSPDTSDKHYRTHMGRQYGMDSFRSQFNFSDQFCRVLRTVFCSSSSDRPTAQVFLDQVLGVSSVFHQNGYFADSSRMLIGKKATAPITPMSPCSLSGFVDLMTPPAVVHLHLAHLPPTPPSTLWYTIDAKEYAPAPDDYDHQLSADSDHLMIFPMHD